MDEAMTSEPTAEEMVEIRASIQQVLDQMRQGNERIKKYQDETDALGAETRVLLAELSALVQAR